MGHADCSSAVHLSVERGNEIFLAEMHGAGESCGTVALFRDSEGDWLTTSDLLNTYWDLLTGKEMCEHDAKMMVEEMVYDHFADEKRYYEEICEELDMEN